MLDIGCGTGCLLRPATARAAAQARRKLAARLSPGEKNGRKRMAELASVYDAVPAPHVPADIIAAPGQDPGRPRAPGPAAVGSCPCCTRW